MGGGEIRALNYWLGERERGREGGNRRRERERREGRGEEREREKKRAKEGLRGDGETIKEKNTIEEIQIQGKM